MKASNKAKPSGVCMQCIEALPELFMTAKVHVSFVRATAGVTFNTVSIMSVK